MQLKDQIALVTGGSRGIGKAIVLALAKEGAKVFFVYRGSKEAAETLATEVIASGGFAQAIQGDVSDSAACKTIVETILGEHKKIDILVNNAGIIKDGLFIRMDDADWNAVINTNLGGTYNFCRAVAYPMMGQRKGRIINISSVAATHVNKGQANYAASKGAVNSLTMALATELAPRGITVNAIAPGFISTDMSEAVRNAAGDFIEKKLIPMKRLGQPDDIANLVVFLAGPSAGYLTGQIITVDGGMSLGPASP
jgi:3-oxoacyl-[acyl-carrier protein] reductase